MKTILLINPTWLINNDENLWKKIASCFPSLGLGYLAAVLERDGHKVFYLDCTAEKIALSETKERLRQYPNIDFVGITATTPLIDSALSAAAYAKEVFPNVKVVLGGVHPSVMPDEVLSCGAVDYVVRDEGEETMLELVNGKADEEILGLSYKRGGKIIHNPPRPLIQNLDTIPAPSYHLMPFDKYYPPVGGYKRLPAMSIFATRGCPGRCTYCYRTFRGVVRKRSAENIVDEIKLLQKDYGIKEICFYDDTFTLFKDEIKKFCRIIIDKKIDLTWSCFTRVDCVDEDLLKMMKKAGCHLILFGVESADEQVLKNIKKMISLDQVKEVVKICRKIGIETRASFMIGNIGDTEETVKKTIKFAIDLDPDEVQFNVTTIYPGTEMWQWAHRNGYITCYDWSKYSMSNICFHHPNLTQEQMKYYYKLAHLKFYFRPKIILRRLFRIKSWLQLKQEIVGALALLGF